RVEAGQCGHSTHGSAADDGELSAVVACVQTGLLEDSRTGDRTEVHVRQIHHHERQIPYAVVPQPVLEQRRRAQIEFAYRFADLDPLVKPDAAHFQRLPHTRSASPEIAVDELTGGNAHSGPPALCDAAEIEVPCETCRSPELPRRPRGGAFLTAPVHRNSGRPAVRGPSTVPTWAHAPHHRGVRARCVNPLDARAAHRTSPHHAGPLPGPRSRRSPTAATTRRHRPSRTRPNFHSTQ